MCVCVGGGGGGGASGNIHACSKMDTTFGSEHERDDGNEDSIEHFVIYCPLCFRR